MNAEVITQMILTVGVVPALLVFLVYSDRKERKEERDKSQERELKLMQHISKSDENMNKFADSLAKVSGIMDNIDRSMGYLQRDVEDLKKVR